MLDAAFLPPPLNRPGEFIVHPFSHQSIGDTLFRWFTGAGSANYPAANVGLFVPFTIPEPITFLKMFWLNGASVAGNLDAGLFREDGTLIVSTGSTAQATINVVQAVTITSTRLDRGRYYLGITGDTASTTQRLVANTGAAGLVQSLGLLEDTACAPPLATNANPASFSAYTRAYIPWVGAQGYRTVGP